MKAIKVEESIENEGMRIKNMYRKRRINTYKKIMKERKKNKGKNKERERNYIKNNRE